MAQPLGTAIYAMKKLPSVLDKDVAVVGQGPMGQLFDGVLRNLGAREIIGVDPVESRLANSRRMGATATVSNRQEDPAAAVRRITEGRMAEVVIEAVGHHDQAFNLCIDLCQKAVAFCTLACRRNISTACVGETCFIRTSPCTRASTPISVRNFPWRCGGLARGASTCRR